MLKLFIVVRADLPIGLQMAQAIHAAVQYVREDPHELTSKWYETSNNVIVKHVPDEQALAKLVHGYGWQAQVFSEPDLGGAWTAAAFMGEGANAYLRELPLAQLPQALAA